MDTEAVCVFFGGTSKPLHRATLWRGVRDGRYPAPIKLSPRMCRWIRQECEAARDKMIAARGA
jgi:predicted DNA-binding transcriptional regulator AlpA